MITLTLQRNTVGEDLERLIDRISRPGPRQTRSIGDAIRQQFGRNFTRQGSGAGQWAPLAPYTVALRQHRGFPGQRPILVQTGRYRDSFTRRGASDHFDEVQYGSGYTTISVGSDDERGPELELGRHNMPARPVTILDDSQSDQISRVIDFVVRSIEHESLR